MPSSPRLRPATVSLYIAERLLGREAPSARGTRALGSPQASSSSPQRLRFPDHPFSPPHLGGKEAVEPGEETGLPRRLRRPIIPVSPVPPCVPRLSHGQMLTLPAPSLQALWLCTCCSPPRPLPSPAARELNSRRFRAPCSPSAAVVVPPNDSLLLPRLSTASSRGRGPGSDSALIWHRGRHVADTQ